MKWMNDPVRVAAGEEGIEPGLMRVRVALMQLPQLSCPVGFEHRLQRRLAGVRTAGNSRGWTLGWLG
ncbi:hypothetical protein KKH27_04265, partial [bacterium]|nr:hypothetical protein [bacterium]